MNYLKYSGYLWDTNRNKYIETLNDAAILIVSGIIAIMYGMLSTKAETITDIIMMII